MSLKLNHDRLLINKMRINYHVCANSISLHGGFNLINQLEDGEADLQKGKIAHLNADSGTIVQ